MQPLKKMAANPRISVGNMSWEIAENSGRPGKLIDHGKRCVKLDIILQLSIGERAIQIDTLPTATLFLVWNNVIKSGKSLENSRPILAAIL